MNKEVKIIGLSVNKNFGGLKATELTFDENNKLTVVKGEVGAGKTTLNKALSLTTKGSKTLEDNNLYGEVDLTAQLLDGEHKVFVECKTNKAGAIVHTIYTIDENGNKLKDVVIDGQKLTPANYLKSLQTSLTWRLDELTSENPTTQRNLLLELYQKELEKQGVIFDKNHPKYTESIIHKIEKAKSERNYADMKRKEVGGIQDDLNAKGIQTESRMHLQDVNGLEIQIRKLYSEREYLVNNSEQAHKNALNELKTKGLEINSKLKDCRDSIKDANDARRKLVDKRAQEINERESKLQRIYDLILELGMSESSAKETVSQIGFDLPKLEAYEAVMLKQLEFNEKGSCISGPEEFKDDKEIFELLTSYREVASKYQQLIQEGSSEVDTAEIDNHIETTESEHEQAVKHNKEAKAVNALHDWKDANEAVKSLQNDFYKKLTDIDTGVDGLHIALDNKESNDIFLMYDGSYDKEYFNNPDSELRKLSSYSDTQKPLICLLIQNYLLSKKGKSLPYLWIDRVPIDNKTRKLLERMSSELGLWLFVSWTGDFDTSNLQDGELLIENGEVFFNGKN